MIKLESSALMKSWHPIAWSKDLKKKPIPAVVLNQDVVVFRDEAGVAHVIQDRCIHKGVKLSGGRCFSGGIQCPYHGWVFDGDGKVTSIPSHVDGDKLTKRRLPSYKTVEQQGTIWFTFSDAPYESTPPLWNFFDKSAFTTVLDMDCEYIRVIENLVDNPHAGYLHGGLLRGAPSSHVTAIIKETNIGVHIQTVGEKARRSLLYRVFGQAERDILHTEEYVAPNIVRITYEQPGVTHVSLQYFCVPVTDKKTRIYYRVTLDARFKKVLLPFLKRMVDKLLLQDKVMLEHEAIQDWKYAGHRKIFCKADTPSIWTKRIAQKYEEIGPKVFDELEFKSVNVEYYL